MKNAKSLLQAKNNLQAKLVSRKEQQFLQGGWGGLWVCPNGYFCYFERDECDSICPQACMFSHWCP